MQVKFWTLAAAASALVLATLGLITMQRPALAAETLEAASEDDFINRVCVFGWSKNNCGGELEGNVIGYSCQRIVDGQVVPCRTVHLRDAVLKFTVRQNSAGCSPVARCDETPHLEGTMVIRGEFIFRGGGSCPYRGSWEGEWFLVDLSGQTVAAGTGGGTLGTGSHRSLLCPVPIGVQCGPNCEPCYDVSRSDVGGQTFWHVGLEGALQGDVFAGEFTSSRISITLSGMLNTTATEFGVPDFGHWRYCGASDGVVLAKCGPIPVE